MTGPSVLREAPPGASFRGWLDRLAGRGRLAIAKKGISLEFELAAIGKRLEGEKAVFFPRPGGHGIAVVAGLLGERLWIAEAMGVAEEKILERFAVALKNPLPWREIPSAPVQEVVFEKVDLGRLLPIPTHNELDSGPYISAGVLVARNPESGVQNLAIHRCQVNGPDELALLLLPRHTLHFYEAAERAGEALDIAIVIGVDPLTALASQAIAPLDLDELAIAGALHGAPVEVVACLGNPLRVPAHAEIVLEGRLLPKKRSLEGPFGEFPQYYSERRERHLAKIDRVTLRRDALYHTILGGGREHLLLGAIPREASLLGDLRRHFPGVIDVHLPMGGAGRFVLYVKLEKRREGEGKNVILAAFAAHPDLKEVVVVDEDVDIHRPAEVEWALATRFQADRDLLLIEGAQGSRLDPSAKEGVGAKMGLDATRPLDAPPLRYKRIRVPGEEKVDLDAVLDSSAGGDWRRARGRGLS